MANPLKISVSSAEVLKLDAADFASIARENGDLNKAKLWDEEASRRGEKPVPSHLRVSFNDAKEKIYVPRSVRR